MKTHHAFLFCVALLGGSLGGCDKSTSTDAAPAKADAQTAKAEPTAKPDAKPDAKAEPAAAAESFTCDAAAKHQHCTTYKPIPGLVDGLKTGCDVGSGGAWTPGENCPKEKIVATCTKKMHDEHKYFYEGVKLDLAEKACTSFDGTWALGSG